MGRRRVRGFLVMASLMAMLMPEAVAAGRGLGRRAYMLRPGADASGQVPAGQVSTTYAYPVQVSQLQESVGAAVARQAGEYPRVYRNDGWSTWDLGNFMGQWRPGW